ncbi:glycosyltransferase family 39 protein [bacterium]|nr:glycosyltransferase family 39 protein [candidate division CSSED10-310 bacterium]
MTPTCRICLMAGIVMLAVVMSLVFIGYGRLFLDSGFYLNAAVKVYEGELLYRDFFYVQGPVYPYVYGAFLNLLGDGVLQARIVSLIFSLIAFAAAAGLAKRWAGPGGALWAGAFLAVSAHHAYFFTSIKLYALTGALLTLSGLVLTGRIPAGIRYPLGSCLAVLALGTRLTVLPGVAVLILFMIVDGWKLERTAVLWGLLSGLAAGCVLAVPFLLAAPEAVYYNIIKIHVSAESGSYVFSLPEKIKVLIKMVLVYPLLIPVGAVVLFFPGPAWRMFRARRDMIYIVLTIVVITGAHMSANWFSVGYQSILMPLAAAVSGGILGTVPPLNLRKYFIGTSVAVSFLSGMFFAWQPFWPGPGTVLHHLEDIGRFLRSHVPPEGTVMGCNGVFALDAGCQNEPPFGGAPFTFTPAWNTKECLMYGGINTHMIVRLLDTRKTSVLLLEPGSFSVGFPGFFEVSGRDQSAIFDAVNRNYQPAAVYPNIGNGASTLTAYLPKDDVVDR